METVQSVSFFENLRGLIRPEDLSRRTGFSIKTIYNWNYESKASNDIPQNLFVKFRGKLFIRADVFKDWVSAKNPEINWDLID